jgi:hypothetical protein
VSIDVVRDAVVVPSDRHGEVLGRQVPELGVEAGDVADVAPDLAIVDRLTLGATWSDATA